MLHEHAGYFHHPFGFGCHDAAVACDDIKILIHDDRVNETELPQAGTKLQYLFLVMGAGVPGIRD
jgi:hypothetical protein